MGTPEVSHLRGAGGGGRAAKVGRKEVPKVLDPPWSGRGPVLFTGLCLVGSQSSDSDVAGDSLPVPVHPFRSLGPRFEEYRISSLRVRSLGVL